VGLTSSACGVIVPPCHTAWASVQSRHSSPPREFEAPQWRCRPYESYALVARLREPCIALPCSIYVDPGSGAGHKLSTGPQIRSWWTSPPHTYSAASIYLSGRSRGMTLPSALSMHESGRQHLVGKRHEYAPAASLVVVTYDLFHTDQARGTRLPSKRGTVWACAQCRRVKVKRSVAGLNRAARGAWNGWTC
jgi:hypothetical protein